MNIIDKIRGAFAGQKAVASLRSTWENSQPTYSIGANFEQIVKQGYMRNELIYTCISKTAQTTSQLQLNLTKEDGEMSPQNHPFVRLMRRPNPAMNEAEFYGSIVLYQKLAGRAIYEIERSNAGQPVALWPLRPDRIKVLPDQKRPMPAAYIYEVPGLQPVTLKPRDVVDFPLFNPLDPLGSMAPAVVASRTIDVDNAVTDYLKLFFEKSGTPPGLLKTKQKLRDVDVTDIRRRWRERYGGFEHWTEPVVLDSDAEYQSIGSSFKDMGFDVLDARNEARICEVMQVPPIIVGTKFGLDRSTLSNFAESRVMWWQDVLFPMYEGWLDQMDQLLRQFDQSGLYLPTWDKSKVYAFAELNEQRVQKAMDAWTRGLITRAEYRSIANLPIDDTDKIFMLSGAARYIKQGDDITAEEEVEPEPEPIIPPTQEPQTEEGDETVSEEEEDEKADIMAYRARKIADEIKQIFAKPTEPECLPTT